MTIGKGTGWGRPGSLPAGSAVVTSDHDLRALVVRHLSQGQPLPLVGLAGGGLWRTVGGPGSPSRLHTDQAMQLPVDVVQVDLDGTRTWFVSQMVVHRVRSRHWTLALNGQYVGTRQFGPKAHPGDALIDVYQAELGASQLFEVVRRARHGAHLPHPGITARRAPEASLQLAGPATVWMDGRRHGRASLIALQVLPDALTVVV